MKLGRGHPPCGWISSSILNLSRAGLWRVPRFSQSNASCWSAVMLFSSFASAIHTLSLPSWLAKAWSNARAASIYRNLISVNQLQLSLPLLYVKISTNVARRSCDTSQDSARQEQAYKNRQVSNSLLILRRNWNIQRAWHNLWRRENARKASCLTFLNSMSTM